MHQSEREFQEGDYVYLQLQPYRKSSLAQRHNLNLGPRFLESFKILKCIGKVAQKLDLPPSTLLHPVFHVSQLKLQLDSRIFPIPELTSTNFEDVLKSKPVTIFTRPSHKVGNREATGLLIQCQRQMHEGATSIFYLQLKAKISYLAENVF